jgi:hypothetical protein
MLGIGVIIACIPWGQATGPLFGLLKSREAAD